jgi:hypothetical protein
MIKKVNFAPDRFEVYVSSTQNLIFALFFEAILLCGIYVFTVRVRDYVFIIVLSFFFLAIASAVWPMMRSIRNGNRTLVWGASRVGIEVPALTTTWTKMRPPVIHEWNRIKKLLLVEKLTYQGSDGRTTTWHAFVILFNESQLEEAELAQANPLRKLWMRTVEQRGARHKLLWYPKKFREDIFDRLREWAPDSIGVEELQRYEVS